MLMKKQFQSKSVPRGTRTIWRYLGALFILFTFAVGNVWGAYDVPADGTVTLSQKVNNGGRFNVEASGVYHFRTSSGYSWDSSNGIKTQSNAGGVVFYLDASKEIEVGIVHTEAKNAHEVTVHVYSITESVYKQFDDNKAGAAESNRTFSTAPTSSTDGSFTISITAESKTFTGKKTLAAGYYAVVPVGEKSKTFFKTIKFTAAAKTNPTITFNNGAYSVGSAALDLSSLFSSNSDGAVTYSVKTDGSTNASISGTNFTATAAGTAVVTASQAATSTYNAATKDANIVVTVPSTPTHGITYNNTKGAANPNPDTYYEGTGVASFEPLADVTDFHFTGWDPASIGTTATGAQTITAQWVAAYDVTFSAGAGSGTVPATFQKWEGAQFNLPGQGEMTAPAGKAFDGWKANGAGDKLAAETEYTMSNGPVQFVAQWKAVPVVLFHYQQSNLSGNLAAGTYDAIGGTLTTSAAMNKESAAYNAAVPNDLKGGANVSKLGSNAAYIQLTLTTGNFIEGDTVYICGYNPYKISSTTELTVDIAASITTGTAKTDYNIGYAIIPEGIEQGSIYLSRAAGNGTGFAAVKVIRPAAKEVVSTVNTLTDVKVNGTSISAANLASLVSEHNLALSDGAAAAPTITFNKHTVITYDDNSNKVTDTPIEVTATVVEGKWSANTTIDAVTYTVTLVKLVSYEVTYAAGDGEGTMTDSNSPYIAGAEVTLLANAFTAPTDKEFDAWVVTKTNGGASVTVTDGKFIMPAEAVTVTASWKDITYAVTYHANGATGTVPAVADYAANAEVTVLGKGDLARQIETEAATFYGWNTKADMSGTRYEAGAKFNMPAADVDLYAVWGFAINYNLDGGTINGTYPTWYVSDGATTSILTQLPTNVTREGYEFGGWYAHNGAGDKLTAINAGYYGNFEGEWALKAKWLMTAPIGKAQSIDMEGLVESDGTSAEWQNYLYSHGYSFSTTNVSLDEKKDPSENKAYDNWPYQGLKMKKSGAYVQGTVEADKLVIIKLGHMAAAATVTIGGTAQANATGLDAAEPAGQLNYYYVENESVLRYETTNDGACVLKAITITDPYTVSFAAHGDADPAALDGHPAVTLPTPTNGTASFLGWFTAETGGTKIGDAGESYTPSADITLHAQWEAVSTDARLSAIEITPNTGVLAPAFNMELTEYTYTMPYGTAAVPTITSATPNHEGASYGYIVQAEDWGDVAEIRGIALSNDTKKYQITMVQTPKDGVSIIKVATTGGSNKTVTGVYAGDGDVNLSSNKKMDNGKYIGFTLDGTTLQAGDRINVHTTQAANTGGSHVIFYDNMTDKNELYETGEIGGAGDNIFTINAAMEGKATAYVYRSNADAAHQWNGYVDFIEVLRAMNPMLTAITIDGRAGVIDEANKTVAVTIPYEADLAALTVVPTIIRNAAHATTPEAVISNEGAWVIGDNTYRVMDKDGDYTDYTITLTRDVLKHTVSFNVHGGSAVASELVVDGEHLAVAPADPTKEDYIFQGWAETADGAVVDVTSFAITADKEFHAVWASDGGIKLLDGSIVNTTDFITGVTADETVEFQGSTVNYAKFAGTVSSVSGVKALDRVIAYNAKTTQTKIRISAHNNNTSARNILVKGVVEGSTDVEDLATIALGNKEDKVSDWIEFDNAANRTIYIFVSSSASDVYFTQVKVLESGDALKKAGEAGYSLNLNQGRPFGVKETDIAFEGIHMEVTSDYQPTNSTVAKLKETSISFDVNEFVKLKVTTATTNKTYYMTRGAEGTNNAVTETTEMTLTPGKWYITAGSSEVQITKIEFSTAGQPDYTRNVSNNIGTLCVDHNVLAGGFVGATFYQIAGRNQEYSYKIDFEEVGADEELVAGEPYIFQSTTGKIELYYGKTVATQPVDVKGMHGTFSAFNLTITEENKLDVMYISNNKLWNCGDLVGTGLNVVENRAYIVMSEVPEQTSSSAPGRRRITLVTNAEQVATGVDTLNASETPVKVMINGQIFIIRGEKMFGIDGKLIK